MVTPTTIPICAMGFDQRLHDTRKERGLTQEGLAERVGIHVSQIRRYEAGTSVPTLDVLRNLATTLAVATDFLVFDDTERDPDDELRFQFETVAQLDPEDRAIIRAVIDAIALRHQARRYANAS